MAWEFVVAMAVVIPLILFPAAMVWYLNLSGVYSAIRGVRSKRTTHLKKTKEAVVG